MGAQTQRSLVHFSIGDDRMPKRVYHVYGYVKKAAALVNAAPADCRNGRSAEWSGWAHQIRAALVRIRAPKTGSVREVLQKRVRPLVMVCG